MAAAAASADADAPTAARAGPVAVYLARHVGAESKAAAKLALVLARRTHTHASVESRTVRTTGQGRASMPARPGAASWMV